MCVCLCASRQADLSASAERKNSSASRSDTASSFAVRKSYPVKNINFSLFIGIANDANDGQSQLSPLQLQTTCPLRPMALQRFVAMSIISVFCFLFPKKTWKGIAAPRPRPCSAFAAIGTGRWTGPAAHRHSPKTRGFFLFSFCARGVVAGR